MQIQMRPLLFALVGTLLIVSIVLLIAEWATPQLTPLVEDPRIESYSTPTDSLYSALLQQPEQREATLRLRARTDRVLSYIEGLQVADGKLESERLDTQPAQRIVNSLALTDSLESLQAFYLQAYGEPCTYALPIATGRGYAKALEQARSRLLQCEEAVLRRMATAPR